MNNLLSYTPLKWNLFLLAILIGLCVCPLTVITIFLIGSYSTVWFLAFCLEDDGVLTTKQKIFDVIVAPVSVAYLLYWISTFHFKDLGVKLEKQRVQLLKWMRNDHSPN